MSFPFITAAMRVYLNFMQQEFQLGPKQEEYLQDILDRLPFKRTMPISSSEVSAVHNFNSLITNMRFENISWPEIVAAIRANPANFFTESI